MIRNRKLKLINLLLIAVSILTCLSCKAQSSSTLSLEKDNGTPENLETQQYAEHYNITPEQAINRFAIIDSIPDGVQDKLSTIEKDRYGGLWIQHEPEFKIVVAFTHDGEEVIGQYFPAKLLEYIEVRQVTYSLAELEKAQQEALEVFKGLNIPVDSGIDIRNNSVEVNVTGANWDKYQTALDAGKIKLAASVIVKQAKGLASNL